jgi:excisionase family DNA binding protein
MSNHELLGDGRGFRGYDQMPRRGPEMMGEAKTSSVEAGGDDGLLSAFDERVKRIARSEAAAVFEEREGKGVEDDKGITAKEAALLIGVSEWRVYEMIKRKVLPAYRPSPQRLRLRLGAVREFIRQGAQQKP